MIRSKCFLLFTLIISIFLSRCANPVAPEGGPKDVTPPKVIFSDPPSFSTHFHQKEIHITFNKYLQLKDEKNQVNISPPLLPHTDIRLRGKSIYIKLSDSLKSNTTYSISFGDAISDLTEGNILHNYTYVFSTGSYVDSLSLSGRVITAFDLVPQKDVLAMLFVNENDTLPLDSLPFHVRPYYMAKTNENGEFTFRNLRNVPFLLFALKDMNGNYIFDMPNEKIAFSDSLIKGIYVKPPVKGTLKRDSLKKDSLKKLDKFNQTKDTSKFNKQLLPGVNLKLFEEIDSTQRVLKADMVNENEIGIFYKFPTKEPKFIPLNIPDISGWMLPEISRNKDSVYLWLKNPWKDSLILQFVDKDKVLDTARIDLKKKSLKKKKTDKGAPKLIKLKLTSNMPDGKINQFKTDPIITFSYPLSSYDLSRIHLVEGKDTVNPRLSFLDSLKRKLRVNYKWKEDRPYQLIIPDSIFSSLNGNSNDSVIFFFRSHALRDFGSIQITITIPDPKGNYLIQLLDEKENIIEQQNITASGKVKFDYLNPAKYKIKAIFDKNQNGQWDSGKFSRKIQPENVLYFEKIIEVRANWDIDESWEL
ncbi:MAG: Ig-like domain-containing protein [Bacteroidales bacterium]